ncbi:hypothetical protein [Azohydromonas lata]|uniref:PEP-CTERM protein-sorting domain-containing protein n=1 Tax=Azohydromonas lata TaxID=45677 RepID=A0ABU5IG23_9BURK|nr:hypothetical protein [Azohydromonas lata]MDZ5458072.1 hypothetical protein [Azohydromonas lata]
MLEGIFDTWGRRGRWRAGGGWGAALRWLAALATAFAALGAPLQAHALGVRVPGTANPWLAGMPDGSIDPPDSAPAQSPVLLSGLDLSRLDVLTFSVRGGVANCPATSTSTFCCPECGRAFPRADGPVPGVDGATEVFTHAPVNGMSNLRAPINSLIGVFLGPSLPTAGPTPDDLDFSGSGLGLDFRTLHPQLKQTFFIGDGLTGRGSGERQQFFVPEGATRLYLGTMDGYEWSNNAGAFRVRVPAVPEPPAPLLLALGAAALAGWTRRGARGRPMGALPA